MEITGIQIASIVFSVFMIYFTYVCYRRKYFEVYGLFIWMAVFVILIVVTLFPGIFLPVQRALRISRLFDLFLVAGIFLLITITYVNFLYIQQLRGKIDKLVQNKAIEAEEDEKKKENQSKS